ncbi:MAG: hypothetical protein A2W26_13775 [Acidobacteria bacterium RBG_16_64_8]|nr:MAG: hypothetical protein A2W26_13775 [Acidobacteria bacterium RBG_16_64_8]
MLWRWYYYGELLPNTVLAKSRGGWTAAILGGKYVLAGLAHNAGFLAIGVVGLPWLWRRGAAWRFLTCYCGAFLAFVALSGGDWMPAYRFFVPVLPLLLVLLVASLAATAEAIPKRAWVFGICAAMAVGSFFAGRTLVRAQQLFPSGLKHVTWHSSPMRLLVAQELRRRVPRGDTLALAECGYIPYFNPGLRIMDVLGLMDKSIARMPGLHMHKMTAGYFLRQRPDYYLMMLMWGQPSSEGIELLRTPAFREQYEAVAYFDGMKMGLQAIESGKEALPIEEDQSFILYQRRAPR